MKSYQNDSIHVKGDVISTNSWDEFHMKFSECQTFYVVKFLLLN